MNNRSIDVEQHFNYLGIILDENMSWRTHIAMVRNMLELIGSVYGFIRIDVTFIHMYTLSMK